MKPWWTPRYFFDKGLLMLYEKSHPDHPWLTRDSVLLLSRFLNKSSVGLELGSGRSTLWFALRVSYLTSIEQSPIWYEKVRLQLASAGITNVNLIFSPDSEGFMQTIRNVSNESLDFALVDAGPRSAGANTVTEKIRPGGLLIVDNANRFLPSNSRAPKSRRASDGPRTTATWEDIGGYRWADFLNKVSAWECIWTCNGVADTVLWRRPLE